MRFKLYEVEIERVSGWSQYHIVAESEERAADLAIDYEIVLKREHIQLALKRVDETLPHERCKGLDDMLEGGPVGLASYHHTIGWVVHAGYMQQLRFFRIVDLEESKTFVIVPNPDIASALYFSSNPLAKGERRVLRIFDGFADLLQERIANVRALLEFGPVGIVTYHE
tara:strand:- start:2202 stop:2708 length:507 start_codon:yes stop_codon:yes gene_type:complete